MAYLVVVWLVWRNISIFRSRFTNHSISLNCAPKKAQFWTFSIWWLKSKPRTTQFRILKTPLLPVPNHCIPWHSCLDEICLKFRIYLLRLKFHQWSVIDYLLEHFTNDPGWDCTVFSLLSKKFLLFLSKYCHSFEIQSLFIADWTCSLAVSLHLLVLHQCRGSCLSYVWKGSLNMIHYVFKRNKEKSI